MEQGLIIVIPLAIFFFIDCVVMWNMNRNNEKTDTKSYFFIVALCVSITQGCAALTYATDYCLISLSNLLIHIIYIIFFTTMAAAGFSWYLYLCFLLSEKKKMSIYKTGVTSIPVLVMFIMSLISPFFHWVYYLTADGVYHAGIFVSLQFICPYVYVLMGFGSAIRAFKAKQANVNKILRNFSSFAIPTIIGCVLQLAVFSGGYSMMGLSFGLIMMYFEQYMEEVAENKRLRSVYEVNRQLKIANEELVHAKKAADVANEAKTAFLFNMSHDLHTPMNAILGFTELMKKEENDPVKVEDYRAKIEESGQYLLSIINNVLDMGRVESEQIVLDEYIMDVIDEDRKILEVLRSDMEKKHLNFTHKLNVKNRFVIADQLRMKQILLNLLGNAVKYTPDGGSIHLETKEIPCNKEGYGTYVVSVSDTGIGISKEFQEHIFDPFSRERNTTDAKVIGTGLGMAIVKKLIDLMDGCIEVESESGKGSKFTVTLTLKIAEQSGTESEKPEESNAYLVGKRILLAEDNELNAEIAIVILEEIGLQVERAEDGVQCIDMLNKAKSRYYDLILMDIQMPNLDGYRATEKIRQLADSSKANIPIVAMTANTFAEDREKAFSVGMNGHLAKPINVAELMKALAGILG